MVQRSRNKNQIQCHTLHDLYVAAKALWNQRDYVASYRLFHHLESIHQYQSINCAWYKIQCLIQLGYVQQAINLCLTLSNAFPKDPQWYLAVSEIYVNQQNYHLAHDILLKASKLVPNSNDNYDEIQFQKRITYEAQQRQQAKDRLKDIVLDLTIPYDILFSIFDYLDLKSLVRCTAVSKAWREFLIDACPHLWSKLEFRNNKAKYLGSSVVNVLLNRLSYASLKTIIIRHYQADGDGVLLTLVKYADQCRNLNTFALFNVLVTPIVFFNALDYIGAQLTTLEWGGVSIWLNDLMEYVPKACTQLKHLVVYDCFTSLYSKNQCFISHKFNCLESLELSNVHGLKSAYLAHILSQCPNLTSLILRKSNVDITSILGILKMTSLRKLKHFDFEKNVFAHLDTQKVVSSGKETTYRMELVDLRIKSDNTLENSDLQYLLYGTHYCLETLDLSGSILISDSGLLVHQHYAKLKTLCLKECYSITSQALVTLLTHSPLIETVDLSYLSIVNNDVLNVLSEMTSIRHIDLAHYFV
ncbi:hypothetical protein G6F57_000982 [Rhizopus arrhizus]|uniref:F-box domain-containing protein n=1 Tax=Rhizopus oryzae TaxID=64495 RepID=A0A9P6X7D6_RHIOR|nr:hypothetical protein G6F23_000989 [Rhizopus arrhizus]KAG1423213.1 hypothetical protein G6F58_002911 [Rhizopus delemar]KAG0765616.1 hypothetical protein G6F24_004281 [Rhizopus arrhizus]KAG0789796.1 hypothetical protein G6F21_006266 [Rhizopus arrhizus]KAG0800904.1 hypothetical protein G6F22_001769 [Rhizopus arrhizus]